MLKPEILAPAGGMDALRAAVGAGADAVYLGMHGFNARRNASNFGEEELKEAARYCHIRGVSLYVTLNILVGDEEFPALREAAEAVCRAGADAAIVQDLGAAAFLRRAVPELRLHASTQLSVHTPEGVRALAALGFSRVCLSRELSLREISEIAERSPIELEAFVHGALCMSVSGQCYFSAVLGGRSGNRGLCAQPCRLPFSVPGGTGHDLSLKDLSALPLLGEMARAGVCSFKIEGRMKRPEYVAAAVGACRAARDGSAELPAWSRRLEGVFSRSGFTNGYLNETRGRPMFGVRQREDAASEQLLSEIRSAVRREPQRVPLAAELTLRRGEPAGLILSDGAHTAYAAGPVPLPAEPGGITGKEAEARMNRLGGTPYFIKDFSGTVEEGLKLPASELNALRRQAVAQLDGLRAGGRSLTLRAAPLAVSPHTSGPCRTYAFFRSFSQVPKDVSALSRILLPLECDWERAAAALPPEKLCADIPRGLFGREEAAKKMLAAAQRQGVTKACAGNLGAAALALSEGFETMAGIGMNLFNTLSLAEAEQMGFREAAVSFELSFRQISSLGGSLPRGAATYGRLPLMLTRNCPAANGRSCAACGGKSVLTDRKKAQFPVRCRMGCSEVLNSVPLWAGDCLENFGPIDFSLLLFQTETKEECAEILRLHQNGGPFPGKFTRGLYRRAVQ